MGKTGPCRHCGVTSTPLWRNGPPDKPVLCNACGSRWRTKGSLTNYTPMHSRETELEEPKVPKLRSISLKTKEHKLHKKKLRTILDREHESQYCDQNYQKMVEGDLNNRSISGPTGSAVSYTESCAHFGTNDASDMTGSAQSNVLDPLVPSKKRAFVTHPKPSRVEELTKELYSIFHEQQSCNLSGCSEDDDLLYDTAMPMDSSETGYGSILIRQPYSKSVEEESEASSLPLEKKVPTKSDAYLGMSSFPMKAESRIAEFNNLYSGKPEKSTTELVHDNTKRNRVPCEKHKILQDRDSPLVTTNLHNVVNFEAFVKFLTLEEQQQLMEFLPLIDSSRPPESLKSMFKSHQFFEAISNFQQLLQEGVFDLSFTLANGEDCRNLKRKMLNELKKSEWVEYHKSLKDGASTKIKIVKEELHAGKDNVGLQKLSSMKRHCDSQPQSYSELRSATTSPKRVNTFGAYNTTFISKDEPNYSNAGVKLINNIDNLVEYEGTCSNPRSLFESPQDNSSIQAPLQYSADSFDQDLLVDVPSTTSFAEAELLYPHWKERMAPNGSFVESGLAEVEESRSSFPSSSFSLAKVKNL